MARKTKSTRPGAKKPVSRRKSVAAVAESEIAEEPIAGAENSIVAATTFCLAIALALLIMASGSL